MERNRIQKIQREELNYSLKDLSKLTSISFRRLKDFEEGLCYPRKKEKEKLKDVLSITSDKYNDEEDLRYPYLENNEKPVNIFRKLFHNKLTLYISLIFVVLFTILFSFSLRECIPFAYNTNAFYRHEIITLRDEVFDRGNKIEDSYILSFDLEYSEISYKFNKDKNNLTDASINYTFKDGSLDYIFSFYSDKFDNRVNVEVINLDKNAAFFYKCIIDGIDEALYYDDFSLTNSSIEDSITVFDEVSLLINTIYQNVDNHLFNNFSIHLLDYLAYLEEGQYNCYSHESEFYYITLILFILLIASLVSTTLSIIYRKKNILNDGTLVSYSDNLKTIAERKELKKDISFPPFLKEGALILISQSIYFLAQFSFFLIFANFFEFGGVQNIPYINTLIDVLRCALPLANTLILFINLNRKIIIDNPLKTAIQYIFFGLIFASYECVLIYDLSRSGDFFIELLISFLPKNLFFAMGIYALIYYFLFKTPLFLKNNKFKIICFRLLCLPFLVFLIFSLIYVPLSYQGLIEQNLYLNASLASISFSYSFIALGYIFLKKLIDVIYLSLYGTINFEKFKRGNVYQFSLNLAFIVLLFIIFILALVFNQNEDMLTSLDLENFVYIPIIFPLIFFYKKRLKNRNIFIDLGSGLAYFISTIISYLLIFMIIIFS